MTAGRTPERLCLLCHIVTRCHNINHFSYLPFKQRNSPTSKRSRITSSGRPENAPNLKWDSSHGLCSVLQVYMVLCSLCFFVSQILCYCCMPGHECHSKAPAAVVCHTFLQRSLRSCHPKCHPLLSDILCLLQLSLLFS